jgi:hypothetical protein
MYCFVRPLPFVISRNNNTIPGWFSMSTMIPPYYDPSKVNSQAERDLFERLRDEPGTEEWTVLHSLALAEHLRQRAGEIDFLVITPLGVFVLEVKGGIVRRIDGLWAYGASLEDRTIKPRSPFDQARDGMFSLENRLKKIDSPLAKLFFGYGVVAPDCSLKVCVTRSEGAENPGVVYDYTDRRSSLREYLKRLAGEAARRYRDAGIQDRVPPSKRDVADLVSLLRGDFEAKVSDTELARDVNHNIVLLEEKQRQALESFIQDERTIVIGAAGTGKTIVAVEAALRAYRGGKRVLFLTFNKTLARYISAKIKSPDVEERLLIIGIHELMYKVIERSSFREELQKRLVGAPQSFWDEWIPEHFSLIQSECPPMCDVLVVDEGQDILTEQFLSAVDAMLKGGLAEGHFIWCMDGTSQGSVYGKFCEKASKRLRGLGVTVALRENIRNTRQIAEAARKLARPKSHFETVMGGSEVTFCRVHSKKEERMRILSIVRNLLEDGVLPGQITVLSIHKNPGWDFETVATELPSMLRVTEDVAEGLSEKQIEGITFSTISSFKGLENDFVIVTEVDDVTSERAKALLYVGMTRARAKLFVLLSPEADAFRISQGL